MEGEFRLTFVVVLNTLLLAFKRRKQVRVFVLDLLEVRRRMTSTLSWRKLLSLELLVAIISLLHKALILHERVALTSAQVWVSLLPAGGLDLTIGLGGELRSLGVCLWIDSLGLAIDWSHIIWTVHLL
jgi:hypothetical protein